MKYALKTVMGVGLVAAVATANAQIALISAGTWSGVDINGNWSQTETVIPGASIISPFAMPSTMSLQTGNAGTTATITYSDGTGDTLVLDATLGTAVFNPNSQLWSDDGSWLYGSGTGTFANLTGSGTLGISQFNHPGGFSGTVLVGELQAVPEPTSYAALGLGLIGLVARRRRK